MTGDLGPPDNPASDEMSDYLQMFLDETEEQLDDLVEALLILEREPHSVDELNESFRLIHSIKGSAGMMGFDNITVLTHHLESRFEAFRSGITILDESSMNLVLRCIDFLRECIRRLRAGEALGSATELLRELTQKDQADASIEVAAEPAPDATDCAPQPETAPPAALPGDRPEGSIHLTVVFEPNLPLADLKARLILSRLSGLGEITSTAPDAGTLDGDATLDRFEIVLETERDVGAIRDAVSLDGVESIEFGGAGVDATAPEPPELEAEPAPTIDAGDDLEDEQTVAEAAQAPIAAPSAAQPTSAELPVEPPAPTKSETPAERANPKVAETMRVDIDRLNRLMNLAGELVVNRARFVQIAGQVGPSFRTRNVVGRARDLGETLRKTIDQLRNMTGANGEWMSRVRELEAGLTFLEEQSEMWEGGRTCFAQIGEAIDQLTRISDSLQQGVLDTRMAPIAPLFNRFNRVVRDLSIERGKKVDLQLHGEKTELDKRMIDELGDPLVHLVRNSIDHGLESTDVRLARGKPEAGTITLEANHSGNNVHISIRDDGGGIDVARVREKIVERSLLSSAAAAELSDTDVLGYIWHAGFSTAKEVTDISGRGVGMDVVKTRIDDLNGTVEIDSTPEIGTTITIRLPLTLAIINSLLVQAREIIFSMPIDDVREIVSVPVADIVTVHGNQTIDVRGQYIPLISIDDIFDWHDLQPNGNGHTKLATSDTAHNCESVAAVVLAVGDRIMSLRVDQLLGSQDIVIKSLTENFVEIRGLSGASILGDGTVCLMLDVGTLIDMAVTDSRTSGQQRERELDNSR